MYVDVSRPSMHDTEWRNRKTHMARFPATRYNNYIQLRKIIENVITKQKFLHTETCIAHI